MQFGEAVHAKTMEGGGGHKLIPRWYVAIWVGVHTPSSSHVVLTPKRHDDHKVDREAS